MMQTFRNNMKIIFYILIFFFVGWMAFTLTGLDDLLTQQSREEMQGMKYAGEVSGEKIERNSFEMRVQNTVNMASSQRASGSLSAWEIDQIADQVWNEMVNDIVLGEAYDRRSIGVNNSEIIEYIRGNPIQELRESPQLQTDGQFDFDKYLALLSNPAAANLVLELEREARQKIPSLKLFLEVGSVSKLTDAELERAFRAVQDKASVVYIEFNPDSIIGDSEVSVSDEEVAAYFEQHKDEYQRPETAQMEYILMPITPGALDSAATLDTLKVVAAMLAGGEQWDSLALRYSQDQLAFSGGDLGWFERGDYTDDEMTRLAFSQKPGEISAPTLTASGGQLVRTDSVRTIDGARQVKAKRILINIKPGRKTLRSLRARARSLRKLMSQQTDTFTKVATDSGFVVSQTVEFAVGNQIPGLEVTIELLNFLNGAKEGQLSYPLIIKRYAADDQEMIMLARVTSRKDKGQIQLDEASISIRQLLTLEAKKEMARGRIEPLLDSYASFDNLTAFATDKGLAVDTSGMFSRASGLTGLGRNNEFVGTAFGLPIGVKSSLIETEYLYYLLEPLQREEADLSQLEENREQLVNQLISSRMQAFFSLFSSELMESMDVKDFRNITPKSDTTANQALAEEK